MKRDKLRFLTNKLDQFEIGLMPFIFYNTGESSRVITIGKFLQNELYYYKYGSFWIGENDGDLTRLVEILRNNIDKDFISKEDNNEILKIINEIEIDAKNSEGESIFMDYIEDDEVDIPDFDNTMICSVCNKEFSSEDISTYKDKEKEIYICLICELEKDKNTHSKYKSSYRANPKDAFDDDEQYIDWYENQ